MQRGATLYWVSTYLAANAFIHIQQLHLEGGSKAQVSANKQSLFTFKHPSKTGKLAVLVHLAATVLGTGVPYPAVLGMARLTQGGGQGGVAVIKLCN